MPGSTIIAGFSSQDKVPGAYGEVKYGAGAISAASLPLFLLLVGLKATGGTATNDTEVKDIYSEDDANTYFAPGSELACMCYDALTVQGVNIKAACPAPAGGAAAATATVTFAGTPTSTGDWYIRVAGKTYTASINTTDTPTTLAAAFCAAINADTKCPMSAANVAGVATLTCKTPGVRGNQHVIGKDDSKLASGVTVTLAGGTALTGGTVPLTGGSGTETYTNLLSTLAPSKFDRIALAANDATSLAAWETQIDSQAGVLTGILQHVIVAGNGTLSASTSLAQTTLNNPRFQFGWHLNSETHPSRIAAALGATRVQGEQDDPAKAYDGEVLSTVAPNQRGDWPIHSTLVSALNNSVTPLATGPDGKTRIIRSITTKSLNGSNPDYRTLDTHEAYVPDFCLTAAKLLWSTEYVLGNPRVFDDLPDGKAHPSGVGSPSTWNAYVEALARDFEKGKIGGGKTIAPIIVDVDNNKPSSSWDGVGERIMTAWPVVPAPAQHQVGISVRQK